MAISVAMQRKIIADAKKEGLVKALRDEFRQQSHRTGSEDPRNAAIGRRRCAEIATELKRVAGEVPDDVLAELKRQVPPKPAGSAQRTAAEAPAK